MTEYTMIDDNTLVEKKFVDDTRSLRRIFDFEACQVSVVYESHHFASGNRGVVMTIQNFNDIQGDDDYIEKMRQILRDLGGLYEPPEPKAEPSLEDCRP